MSDYSKATNFTAKDSLPSGNPSKIVKGSEIDTELTAIQTAVNSKANSASPSFTGTITVGSGTNISTNSLTISDVELGYLDGATSNIQTQITTEVDTRIAQDALKAPIESPTFTGTPLAPTATTGTSTTQIATTAFVGATAFNSALPSQTGNSGKVVTTDGTNASWSLIGTADQYIRVNSGGTALEGASLVTTQNWTDKTANYTAVNGDRIAANTSGGAFTLTLPATPTTGHYVEVTDGGGAFATNNLTVARNGSTIMGLSEDMTVSVNNSTFGLTYNGSTWRLF